MKVWGDVFPDGKVPVFTPFGKINVDKLGTRKAVLINWPALTNEQMKLILKRLTKTLGVSTNEVLKSILDYGLPLLQCFTTGIVIEELWFDVE